MDRPTLQSRLKDAESLVQRLEENIAFQVAYQPIYDLHVGGIARHGALQPVPSLPSRSSVAFIIIIARYSLR